MCGKLLVNAVSQEGENDGVISETSTGRSWPPMNQIRTMNFHQAYLGL